MKLEALPARLGIALGCAALASTPRAGKAFHTEREHVTDDTAWTAEENSFRLGIYKAEYAFHDRVTGGSYLWPWLFKTSSLYVKWRFYSGERWGWATRLGFFRLDTGAFDGAKEGAPIFTVVPFELTTTYGFNPKDQLSQSLVFTSVRLAGELDDDALRGAAEAGVTNGQYVAVYEHRYTEKLALVVTGRYLLFQVALANADLVLHPDEFTTIEVHGTARDDESLDFRAAFSIVPAFAWSWDTFNLRLGVGYGNWNLPGVNFTLPDKSPILDVDFFWMFD